MEDRIRTTLAMVLTITLLIFASQAFVPVVQRRRLSRFSLAPSAQQSSKDPLTQKSDAPFYARTNLVKRDDPTSGSNAASDPATNGRQAVPGKLQKMADDMKEDGDQQPESTVEKEAVEVLGTVAKNMFSGFGKFVTKVLLPPDDEPPAETSSRAQDAAAEAKLTAGKALRKAESRFAQKIREQRLSEESLVEERIRRAERARLQERANLLAEIRLMEESRLVEEARFREEARLSEENRVLAEEVRNIEQAIAAEEARVAAEVLEEEKRKVLMEEQRLMEESRLIAEEEEAQAATRAIEVETLRLKQLAEEETLAAAAAEEEKKAQAAARALEEEQLRLAQLAEEQARVALQEAEANAKALEEEQLRYAQEQAVAEETKKRKESDARKLLTAQLEIQSFERTQRSEAAEAREQEREQLEQEEKLLYETKKRRESNARNLLAAQLEIQSIEQIKRSVASAEQAKEEERERIENELNEIARTAEERRIEEETIASEKSRVAELEEENRLAELKQARAAADALRLEEARLAEEQRLENEAIAAEKARVAELEEENRLAELKREDEARAAVEKASRLEEARLVEEQRREDEAIAAEKMRVADSLRLEEENRLAELKREDEARAAADALRREQETVAVEEAQVTNLKRENDAGSTEETLHSEEELLEFSGYVDDYLLPKNEWQSTLKTANDESFAALEYEDALPSSGYEQNEWDVAQQLAGEPVEPFVDEDEDEDMVELAEAARQAVAAFEQQQQIEEYAKIAEEEARPTGVSPPQESWSDMTVAQLKEELKLRGLRVSGTKNKLIARLEQSEELPATSDTNNEWTTFEQEKEVESEFEGQLDTTNAEPSLKFSEEEDDMEELARAAREAVRLFESTNGIDINSDVGETQTPIRDWSKMTVAQLRGELSGRGLPTTGSKIELIAALEAFDLEEISGSAPSLAQEDVGSMLDEMDIDELDLEALGKAARDAVLMFETDDEPSDEALWEIENEVESDEPIMLPEDGLTIEESADEEPEAAPAPDYQSMAVSQLKGELKRRGLRVTGKKVDLIERLRGSD